MPAVSIADLFNFETNFENPMANYFANANANWQILTPQTLANVVTGDAGFLRTPRLTCEFHRTGTGIQREVTGGREYYADFTGQIVLSAVTQRANVSQNYGLIRGTARQSMLELTQLFNSTTLPYYQVVDITESASTQSPDEGNDEILTQLTYAVTFFIPPSSFP